ncbi:MAG: M20/M25/M40 family metallo-hydrolase [Candidatus Micrarchaeia archaeon]|jgi:acetylornithine deacetylase
MKHAGEEMALSLLRKLVSINSVFPGERKLAEFARGRLKSCGFAVRMQEFAPGRYNVVAQKGRRGGALLLTAHLDTVPPYNYGRRNPFSLEEKGGRLRGLGAWDMKSGLAIVLRCAKECSPKKRGLRIVLTADEENISEGTWAAQRRGEFADCSVAICHEIPDAIRQEGAQGRPPIIIGRRGRCVYRFTVSGVGAHAAGNGGASALGIAMRLAAALEAIPMPFGKTGPCRLFVRKFSSESRSLSVPTEAMLEADVHYVPPHTDASFLAYIKKSLEKTGFFVPAGCAWNVEIPKRKTPYLPAYETKAGSPGARRFLAAYKRHIGAYALSYGLTVADENVLSANGMPVMTVGLKGGEAHSAGEWVSKKDYLLLWEKMPKIAQEMLQQ